MENNSRVEGAAEGRQELASSLTRYIENITREADKWAEQTRKETKEKAELEARAIMARAEEQAGKMLEEKRLEAIALANKEAEFVKLQAQTQIEEWLKEMRETLAVQLRNISGVLRKEMLAHAEELKQRAKFFEIDFEQQISEMLKKEITIDRTGENKPKAEVQTPAQEPKPAAARPDAINPRESRDKFNRDAINEILLSWQKS